MRSTLTNKLPISRTSTQKALFTHLSTANIPGQWGTQGQRALHFVAVPSPGPQNSWHSALRGKKVGKSHPLLHHHDPEMTWTTSALIPSMRPDHVAPHRYKRGTQSQPGWPLLVTWIWGTVSFSTRAPFPLSSCPNLCHVNLHTCRHYSVHPLPAGCLCLASPTNVCIHHIHSAHWSFVYKQNAMDWA